MTPAQSIYRTLWSRLRTLYGALAYAVAVYGALVTDDQWGAFESDVLYLLLWADLIAAAGIRYKALRQRTILPHGERSSLADVERANPWYRVHAEQVRPVIEERAGMIGQAEREYIQDRQNAIAQMVRPETFKHDFVPLWRLDLMRNAAVGEVASFAEQTQLSLPEVNNAFTHSFIYSRDDRRVRPTHRTAHGFCAWRGWEHWPICVCPLYFNCRCFHRFVALHEAIDKGWATESGRILMHVKWPNTLAEKNFKDGKWPEWRNPRYWAWPSRSNRKVA